MRAKNWCLNLLFGLVLAISGFAFSNHSVIADSSIQSAPQRPAEQFVVAQYRWSYAAKFVCGYQPPVTAAGQVGEPVVKPGNYATDINIHNPNYRNIRLDKKLIVLVQAGQAIANEPQSVEPRKIFSMTLNADFATMDDCNNLWKLLGVTALPAAPAPTLTIGYLVILSPLELDVDVVYTAEVNAKPAGSLTDSDATGISIDVERVTGKRVFIPANTFP
jgi:hypothetical protein